MRNARDGKIKIHFSTIAYAEIRPRFFKGSRWGTIEDFFEGWGNAFYPFDPNPNIFIRAGQMRDIDPVNPSDPKIGEERKRRLGAADAVHLSTCLYLKEIGEADIVFHTFDEGKSKSTHEGNCVPLIGFERWYPQEGRHALIQNVCDLIRCKPTHPDADLATQSGRKK